MPPMTWIWRTLCIIGVHNTTLALEIQMEERERERESCNGNDGDIGIEDDVNADVDV